MSAKYIEMKVISACGDVELDEFVRVCGLIQKMGQVGTSRRVGVVVDGDGSGQLSFEVNGEPLDTSKLKLGEEESFRTSIGE